jgi:hypothetical protein
MFEARLRSVLLSVVNVLDIPELEVEISGSSLRYRAVISTTFGRVNING